MNVDAGSTHQPFHRGRCLLLEPVHPVHRRPEQIAEGSPPGVPLPANAAPAAPPGAINGARLVAIAVACIRKPSYFKMSREAVSIPFSACTAELFSP